MVIIPSIPSFVFNDAVVLPRQHLHTFLFSLSFCTISLAISPNKFLPSLQLQPAKCSLPPLLVLFTSYLFLLFLFSLSINLFYSSLSLSLSVIILNHNLSLKLFANCVLVLVPFIIVVTIIKVYLFFSFEFMFYPSLVLFLI